MAKTLVGGTLFLAAILAGGSCRAADAQVYPVIPGYGGVVVTPGASERPDPKLRYRVVFNITKAAAEPDKPNPGLERVARFVNLLGADNVRPAPGDIVAIVQAGATPAILQNAAYAARTKEAENPNVALIAALAKAGVSVRVCSQAMAGHGITPDQVIKGIVIDDAALTTMANLQLRGFALIPD